MQWFADYRFRIALAIISVIITSVTLGHFAELLQDLLARRYSWQMELVIIPGLVIFQIPFTGRTSLERKINYYYNMLLVSLLGSVVLWPLLIVNDLFYVGNFANLVYFFVVVVLMFFVHKHRVGKLKMPKVLSYSYIAYRVILLYFII